MRLMHLPQLTIRAKNALNHSLDEVSGLRHPYVGVEHLLLALTAPDSESSIAIHDYLKDSASTLREFVSASVVPRTSDGSRSVPQTMDAKRSLLYAIAHSKNRDHPGVNSEHLLLGILDLENQELVKAIISSGHIDIDAFRQNLDRASRLDKYTIEEPP